MSVKFSVSAQNTAKVAVPGIQTCRAFRARLPGGKWCILTGTFKNWNRSPLNLATIPLATFTAHRNSSQYLRLVQAEGTTWFPLALACALSLASADAVIKYFFRNTPALDLLAVRMVTTAALLMPLVLLQPLPSVPPVFWGWLAVLVPLELVAMFLYLLAIRDNPLHLTLPFLAFTPVFNVVTGYAVLRESVSPGGMVGILLVVFGAYLLNLKRLHDWRSWFAPLAAIVREPGPRLMLAVAAIYSITSVGGKAAMGYTTPQIFGPFYYVMIGSALLVGLLILRPSSFGALYWRPWASFLTGLLMAVMIVTHFLGIARVEVAYFISVKRTSLLFGIVYGAVLFGERDFIRHFLSGALMVAGVALIVGSGA